MMHYPPFLDSENEGPLAALRRVRKNVTPGRSGVEMDSCGCEAGCGHSSWPGTLVALDDKVTRHKGSTFERREPRVLANFGEAEPREEDVMLFAAARDVLFPLLDVYDAVKGSRYSLSWDAQKAVNAVKAIERGYEVCPHWEVAVMENDGKSFEEWVPEWPPRMRRDCVRCWEKVQQGLHAQVKDDVGSEAAPTHDDEWQDRLMVSLLPATAKAASVVVQRAEEDKKQLADSVLERVKELLPYLAHHSNCEGARGLKCSCGVEEVVTSYSKFAEEVGSYSGGGISQYLQWSISRNLKPA